MLVARLRLVLVNALIAVILAVVLLDALPQAPAALGDLVRPLARRVGLGQHWQVFAPDPDSVNMRFRAEITYRDGQTAVWRSPNWPQQSVWERMAGHRREEWLDNGWGQEDSPAWPGWARHLARLMRPDDPQADRDAEVKIVVEQYSIPPASDRPWRSWREPSTFDESWTLTIEKLP
ncbi:MAG: hypothetical protein WD872_17790 [Pirellulaceae bacterium]